MFTKLAAKILGMVLSKADILVPFKKYASNEYWLVYRHPKPAYPVHFLILPRAAWKDVYELPLEDPRIMTALLEVISKLIRSEELENDQCRLVINGGGFQTAPLLHAHLISG